jgi:alkylation response protein AidB-like acyl-CoA dehydrogenase
VSQAFSKPADTAGDMLREATTRLLADVLTPAVRAAAADGEWPAGLWDAVEELGLSAALLPEEAGGFGVPAEEALSLVAVAGEHALPLPLADTMLAGHLLTKAGLEIPSGPLAVAPGAEVTIAPDGRASGWAWNVPWGRNAHAIVCLAETADGAVLLALPQEGLRIEPDTNMAGEPRDTIRFESAAVQTASAPFGPRELRAAGAATRALMMAGALHAVSAMTAQYAQERKQFGRAIGKFQAVQQNLAVLAGQAASAAAAGDIAAEAVAAWGPGLVPAVAATKVRTGEAAGIGASIAHQVHGAIGFTEEHRLHLYTRRLWAWRDEFGGEAEWAGELGRHLAAGGADGLWPAITAL